MISYSLGQHPFRSLSHLCVIYNIYLITFNRDVVQFLNECMMSRGADSNINISNKRCEYLHPYPFLLIYIYILFNLIVYYHSNKSYSYRRTNAIWSRIQQYFIYIQSAIFARQVYRRNYSDFKIFFGYKSKRDVHTVYIDTIDLCFYLFSSRQSTRFSSYLLVI